MVPLFSFCSILSPCVCPSITTIETRIVRYALIGDFKLLTDRYDELIDAQFEQLTYSRLLKIMQKIVQCEAGSDLVNLEFYKL